MLHMNKKDAPPTTIRNYRPDDLDACRALWVTLTEWHRQIYESPDIGGPDPGHQFDEHLEKVGGDNIWIAEVGGQAVGLTGLIPGDGEAELEPLVVRETHRRLGIGRRLAETVVEAARVRGIGQLTVRPVGRNASAIQFFHALGFGVLGHIELFMDFRPPERQGWQPGERLAERDFKV